MEFMEKPTGNWEWESPNTEGVTCPVELPEEGIWGATVPVAGRRIPMLLASCIAWDAAEEELIWRVGSEEYSPVAMPCSVA
jgi:hypothetical protein